MIRKQIFANLDTVNSDSKEATTERSRSRARPILGSSELVPNVLNSSVGIIAHSLNEASERSKRAEEIEKRLAQGLTIVSLDTADIDPSFIPDRMPASPDDDVGLVEAIREQGQQIPILFRPIQSFQAVIRSPLAIAACVPSPVLCLQKAVVVSRSRPLCAT